ncbi:polysaccharide deacetylase [delta proteobacterium NaphS2]|nr:polysaccharide deacetylase [delta proteobacterium NaphS2]
MFISKAHKLGIICFSSALVPAFYGSFLAVLPLFLFVGVCMIAPFLPRLGFFVPVISRGKSRYKAVSLTFDDGPDPFSTGPLLALLDRHGVKATFFVVGKKVAAHPHLIEKILEKGHLLGNHTYRHDNFCMLKSSRYLYDEINAVQELLAVFHVKTLAFRPPVGITNPKLQGVLEKLGMVTVNFSCRGPDMGNRRLKGLSRRVLKHLQRGHIVALHDVMPKKDGALLFWLCEIDKILQGIKDRDLEVLPLSEFVEQPVMVRTEDEKI